MSADSFLTAAKRGRRLVISAPIGGLWRVSVRILFCSARRAPNLPPLFTLAVGKIKCHQRCILRSCDLAFRGRAARSAPVMLTHSSRLGLPGPAGPGAESTTLAPLLELLLEKVPRPPKNSTFRGGAGNRRNCIFKVFFNLSLHMGQKSYAPKSETYPRGIRRARA